MTSRLAKVDPRTVEGYDRWRATTRTYRLDVPIAAVVSTADGSHWSS